MPRDPVACPRFTSAAIHDGKRGCAKPPFPGNEEGRYGIIHKDLEVLGDYSRSENRLCCSGASQFFTRTTNRLRLKILPRPSATGIKNHARHTVHTLRRHVSSGKTARFIPGLPFVCRIRRPASLPITEQYNAYQEKSRDFRRFCTDISYTPSILKSHNRLARHCRLLKFIYP